MKKNVNCTKCNIELKLKDGNFMEAIDSSGYLCKPCFANLNKYLHECYLQFIQPERSKREDLDCEKCKDIKKGIEWECPSRFIDYLDQSKMRCSEHCGNTVREAQ